MYMQYYLKQHNVGYDTEDCHNLRVYYAFQLHLSMASASIHLLQEVWNALVAIVAR